MKKVFLCLRCLPCMSASHVGREGEGSGCDIGVKRGILRSDCRTGGFLSDSELGRAVEGLS